MDNTTPPSRQATFLGADLSTTALSVGVRGADGHEDFVAIEMTGATSWHDQPGFDLDPLPLLLGNAIHQLEERGWHFHQSGSLSFSVRQHDMVLLDEFCQPLIPALSWECHSAQQEVTELERLGVDRTVGPIAPRFILPKLLWVLRQVPALAKKIHRVATTGDFIAAKLTGQLVLSTSDALSNALLDQSSKKLAQNAIAKTSIPPEWFPKVLPSGHAVGTVEAETDSQAAWDKVRSKLHGWTVFAGLGDNHASAVGCGLADSKTIVISAGSSGTIVRACPAAAELAGNANCFEFYDDRLLLLMLPDCALWYNRFLAQRAGSDWDHASLNDEASQVDMSRIRRVVQTVKKGSFVEQYPESFHDLSLSEQVASTQFSIALELLLLVRRLLLEVNNPDAAIERFVLTGGLCQSPWMRWVLHTGLTRLAPHAKVCVSARRDKLAFQSATYGAIINAIVQGNYPRLPETIAHLCPQQECDLAPDKIANGLDQLVARGFTPATTS